MKRIVSLFTVAALFGLVACSDRARTTATIEAPAKPPFAVNVDASNFDETSATIDNQWWPLEPGTQLSWQGQALDGEDVIRRRIVFTVTDLTKEIAGVKTLVGWDRDFNDGVLIESELIFLAQDKQGNVWHFGQYSEIWDEGQYDGGSAWLVGYLDGAKAGILMPGDPRVGMPAYSEGFAPPPYFWDDYARVYRMGVRTCVPAGCFNDVLVTEEYEPTIPGQSQLKYYARGVGNVRTGWLGDDEEQEELGLVRSITLTPAQLAEARAEALKLEARATLYGLTQPIASPEAG